MNFCSIASGSSGNCIYVGSDNTHLIIDAGLSGKKIEEGLNLVGLKGSELNGILVTHEHIDHTGGLGVMARRYGIPIYATAGTIQGIRATKSLGKIPDDLLIEIEKEKAFSIEDINIKPVGISHDANDPVAYRIENGSNSVGVVTDLGNYDDHIVKCFEKVDALLLEANHDVNMLQVGRYPYPLKQRILSDKGHLSNELSGQLLCKLLHDDMRTVFLGHLSAENNLAELAYETIRLEILLSDIKYRPEDFDIRVASRSECSEVISIA